MAAPLKDLTGKTFGQWSVLRQAERRNRATMWLCRCSCGIIGEVSGSNLKSGLSMSCGCRPRAPRKKGYHRTTDADMVGQRFGRLVVTAFSRSVPGGKKWSCSCECGGRVEATTGNLRTGITTSCGCRRRETTAAIGRANRHEMRA